MTTTIILTHTLQRQRYINKNQCISIHVYYFVPVHGLYYTVYYMCNKYIHMLMGSFLLQGLNQIQEDMHIWNLIVNRLLRSSLGFDFLLKGRSTMLLSARGKKTGISVIVYII